MDEFDKIFEENDKTNYAFENKAISDPTAPIIEEVEVLSPISHSSKNKKSQPLKNQKHEIFCRAVLEFDGDGRKSLEKAGYRYSASYFCQLKSRDDIRDRIQQLIEESKVGNICLLTERLEILSSMVRDKTLSKTIRISALKELHHQSGDDVLKLDVTNNTVKYVEIALPKKTGLLESSTEEDDLISYIDQLDTVYEAY